MFLLPFVADPFTLLVGLFPAYVATTMTSTLTQPTSFFLTPI